MSRLPGLLLPGISHRKNSILSCLLKSIAWLCPPNSPPWRCHLPLPLPKLPLKWVVRHLEVWVAPNRHTGVVDVAAGMVLVLLTSPLPTTLPAFKVELLQRPFLLLLAALFASFEKRRVTQHSNATISMTSTSNPTHLLLSMQPRSTTPPLCLISGSPSLAFSQHNL